jgi:hypothetical protein
MLVEISIIKIYSKFGIFIVDANVESYRLRCWLMMSFAGILNIFLVPIWHITVGIWLVRLPKTIELSTDITWRINYIQCYAP